MNSEIPTSTVQDDEIDLRELIITIVKGWKIILASAVVVTLIAGVYALRLPDQYVVTTKALTTGGGGSASSQMASLAALAGVSMGGGSSEIDLLQHVETVIKNSYFMDHLLAKSWVIPRKQTKQQKKEKKPFEYDTLTLAQYWKIPKPDMTVPDWEYPYKMGLYSRLRDVKAGHISVSIKAGTLEIKTKFDNAALSYQVHQELLVLLKEYFKNDYASRDHEKRVFLEARLSEVKSALTRAENSLMVFRQANMMTSSPRVILEGERRKREVELQGGLYAELIKQLEIAKIDEKKESPIFEVLQPGERPLGPSEPNRKLLIVIGVVLGLALGVFAVFLKEWIKTFFEAKPKMENG